MKKVILVAALALGGCMSNPQKAADSAEYICKSGVEYWVFVKSNSQGYYDQNVIPHYKPGGKGDIYTCDANGYREALGPQTAPAAEANSL